MAFREVTDIQLDDPAESGAPVLPNKVAKYREVSDIQLDAPQEQPMQVVEQTPALGYKPSLLQVPENAQEAAANRQEIKDIVSRFTGNMRERGAKLYDILEAGATRRDPKDGFVEDTKRLFVGVDGKQSGLETIGQALLNSVAGAGLDIIGQGSSEIIKNSFRALPVETQKEISDVGTTILDSKAGQLGLEALAKGGEWWKGFKQENPRAARNIEAITTGLAVATPVGGKSIAGVTKEVAGEVGDVVKSIPSSVANVTESAANKVKTALQRKEKIEPLTSAELKSLSADAYKAAEAAGQNFPDTVRGNLIADFEKNLAGKETLRKGDNDIATAYELMTARKGEPLTLEGAQQIDEELGQLIAKNYKDGLNADGKKLLEIQDNFRDAIEASEGGKLLKEGRALWSASKRAEDIERIIEYAQFTDNPATSIKNGIRTILKNPKRRRGYSKAEIRMMEKAAKSGVIPNTLQPL